jgi:muramoyltetrapeptide carboxypeptidase
MPHAAQAAGWVSATPEERADDIHRAFLDDDVGAVVASIGGNHSNQVLPYLDFDLIAAHPKILQGYSDVTVLLWAVAVRAGLRTFHGPAACLELAEYPEILPYTRRYLEAAWFGRPTAIESARSWTEEFLDFFTKSDLERARTLSPGEGWIRVRGGQAEGALIGGCLETICWHLKGSAYWPDLEGALLFLETSEEAPSPAAVDGYLTDLEQLGVFEQISGLMIGRPYGYRPEAAQVLLRVVLERTERAGIPVLANVDLGHTDPMLTLPIGVKAALDADALTLVLAEAGSARSR